MKKAGIVLEGGGSRGVFTAGILDYFMEQNFYFPYVSGVSAGACNAANYVAKQPYRTRKCMIDYLYENSIYSIKNIVKKKVLIDMDLLFNKIPNDLIPYDYDTFFASDTRCIMVATNCETGKADYFEEKKDKDRLMEICKASSSLPYISNIVRVDNKPYLDGGLADSVPVVKALRDGINRPVLILTRNKGYRKKENESIDVSKLVYRDYPNLCETIYKRSARYNRVMDYIDKLEADRHVIVIRPEITEIDRAEQDTEKLTEFYHHGYEMGKKYFETIKEFTKDCE